MGSYIGEKQTLKTTKHCMGAMNLNVTKMVGCPCLENVRGSYFLENCSHSLPLEMNSLFPISCYKYLRLLLNFQNKNIQ